MGKIHKYGKWVPHQLNDRQMEHQKTICEMLLQRFERKSFVHRIVTGDEKRIYFENPKWKKSWLSPGTLEALHSEILSHPPYSPDLAPSDYHLFGSMGLSLAEQLFSNFEEVEKWLIECFALKEKKFFWNGIHGFFERWAKCVESNDQYFE